VKVNTLIIGAGRSGTTSLFKILESHPEVCFSKIKEVHYFSIEDLYCRGEKYYESFFPHFKNEKIVASADTYLLMDYSAISRIKAYNPEIKIIVMLRNPVDRAYSSYNYSINYGYHKAYNSFIDSIVFEKDIENEESIIQRNNLGHFYGSLYGKHLSEWSKIFTKENLLIITLDELKSNTDGFMNKLSSYLAINPFLLNQKYEGKQNQNAVPKIKSFEQFLLNRDSGLRKFIRWFFPSFLKKLIIHSNIVDKIHELNRKPSEYKPLSKQDKLLAMKYFEKDLEILKSEFGIELL
jgi:hypothetical protein